MCSSPLFHCSKQTWKLPVSLRACYFLEAIKLSKMWPVRKWNIVQRAGEFLWAGGGQGEGAAVCVCVFVGVGLEEVWKWRRGDRGWWWTDTGEFHQYQSGRNVERTGGTWNALPALWSDVMCEVEEWGRAQHCTQHPRYRAAPQIHSWLPDLKQCRNMFWSMSI